ncbi:MAG: hypothetical protein JNM45_05250 [Rhizobiales bacterium]|nr:hypothetical protein [Hyphomicrobiales bacterium]
MSGHPIIALWSHPRSMSTAFERIMRSRGDLDCLHEPFMYDYYVHRSRKVMPHFEAQPEHPVSYDEIRATILAKAKTQPVFFKDMSYYVMPHILADEEFLRRITHSFLIRDPMASIVSYAKLDPAVSLDEIGLESQAKHADALKHLTGRTPVIVQSERVQNDPEGQMKAYWQAVGLDHRPQALNFADDVPNDWQQVSGWHKDVMASKSILPWTDADVAKVRRQFDGLVERAPHFATYYAHHLPFYAKLAAQAL